MAVRTATRRWTDLASFLSEYPTTLQRGALVLPADAMDGPPAPELKVDLVLPLVGRVGPVVAQVLGPVPGVGWATRVPEIPPAVEQAIGQLFAEVEAAGAWLVAQGRLVDPTASNEELARLRARVQALEAALASEPRPTDAAVPRSAGSPVAASVPGAGARGLPLPDLDGVPPALSGTLADRSLRDAFMALALERATGLLVIRTRERVRYGFWSKGGPVGWHNDPVDPEETLGVLLFRAGSVKKEQLEQSLEIMDRRGVRQGEAFIELGLLSFAQLVMLLQKQAEFVLQRVMKDRDGTWEFYANADLPERFVTPPVRVAALMFRSMLGVIRELPAEQLAANLRPFLDRYLFFAPGVDKAIDEMKLTTDEQAFVKIVQGTAWRLREVFSVSSLSRSQTAAMLWCLYELNLIELRDQGTGDREAARLGRELASRKKSAMSGTYFDRLELHWICTTADAEAAWRRLDAEYNPAGAAARFGADSVSVVKFIHDAMREAYDTLRSDAKRREYRLTKVEKGKIIQSAEMLSKKGEMAIMKEARREALDCFGKALELVPNEAEYRAGYDRARTLTG